MSGKILFIGTLHSHQGVGRFKSLQKIYGDKNVEYFEPYKLLFSKLKKFEMAFYYKFGMPKRVDNIVFENLKIYFQNINFEIVWIETPELLGKKSLEFLKSISNNIHLYGNDNPFEGPNSKRFRLFQSSIHFYSSMCFMRESSVIKAKTHSNSNIFREYWSYPEFLYKSKNKNLTEKWFEKNDIYKPGGVFIGTNIPGCKRRKILKDICKSINAIDIYGNKWGSNKKCYPCNLFNYETINEEYIKAIQSRRINIILLNSNNLDKSTTRSVEVPAFRGLGLYPPTEDHNYLLGSNLKDALTFQNKFELVEKINLFSIENNMFVDYLNHLHNRIKDLKLSSYDSINRQLKKIK